MQHYVLILLLFLFSQCPTVLQQTPPLPVPFSAVAEVASIAHCSASPGPQVCLWTTQAAKKQPQEFFFRVEIHTRSLASRSVSLHPAFHTHGSCSAPFPLHPFAVQLFQSTSSSWQDHTPFCHPSMLLASLLKLRRAFFWSEISIMRAFSPGPLHITRHLSAEQVWLSSWTHHCARVQVLKASIQPSRTLKVHTLERSNFH